jgi:hypothetical protein
VRRPTTRAYYYNRIATAVAVDAVAVTTGATVVGVDAVVTWFETALAIAPEPISAPSAIAAVAIRRRVFDGWDFISYLSIGIGARV